MSHPNTRTRGFSQIKPLFSCAGHTGQVTCLAITSKGDILLSGGTDGVVMIWDMTTGEALYALEDVFGGPISALALIEGPADDSQHPAFCYGNAAGHLALCTYVETEDTYCLKSRALGHYHAVEDIKYDPSYGRIGSVSRGSVKFWCVGQNGMLSPTLQSPPEEDFIVRSLCFVSGGEEVLLFYLETHEVACYHLSPWDHRWTKSVDSRIGYAALAPTGKDIYISNLHNGVDRYLLPDLILDRKFHYQIEDNVPLHIATPFDGDLMVVGGDRGIVKVFNTHTGKLVNMISHTKDKSPVQVVATHVLNNHACMIVTASDTIKVWCGTFEEPGRQPKRPQPPVRPSGSGARQHLGRTMVGSLLLSVILTAVGVIVLLCYLDLLRVAEIESTLYHIASPGPALTLARPSRNQ